MRYSKGWLVLLALVGLVPGVGHAESAYIIDRLYAIMRTEAIETSPAAKTIESGTVVEVLQRTERFARVRDKQGAEGWVETRYLTVEPPMRVQLAKLQDELTKARAQTAETQAQLKRAEKALAEQTAHTKDAPMLAPGASPLPVSDAPLRAQIAKLQDDLNKSRAQAADVQTQLKKTETALAEQSTKRKELEKTVASTPATPVAPLRAQIAKLEDDLNKSRTQTADVQTQLKKTEVALAEQTSKRKELEKTVASVPSTPAVVIPAPAAPAAAPAKGAPTPAVAPPPTATGFSFSFVWLGISFAMLGAGFAAGVVWLRESIRKRSGGMYLRV
jgi:uncharacterized protein YgiM (DUF1202 family)